MRVFLCLSFAVLANLALANALRQHGAVMPPRLQLVPRGGSRHWPPEPSLN